MDCGQRWWVITTLILEGRTKSSIAKQLGVSRSTVLRASRRGTPPTLSRTPPTITAAKRRAITRRQRAVAALSKIVDVKQVHRGKTARSQIVTVRFKRYPCVSDLVAAMSDTPMRIYDL